MQRSRLKNIINKSKALNKQNIIGESFDEFKKSLPKELEIGDNYRLEAAWKAYGSPKNYKEALWEGMIQPIDENTFKLPSIGYNEETDEYEYLNKGEDNDIVAKDIRVWDNDVIPFVKELKHGGYIRLFNKEKDCWTYSKNIQERIESNQNDEQQVNSFQKGGKTVKVPYYEWFMSLPKNKRNDSDYDLARAYYELSLDELEEFKNISEKHLDGRYKKPNHPTYSDEGYGWKGSDQEGWTFTVSPRQMNLHNFDWYKNYWDNNEPDSVLIYGDQKYLKDSIDKFKQGGQMNVIPEGALHARKNNMEGAGKDFTHKGIPVVAADDSKEQTAEIERNEIIFTKEVTDKLESYYKQYNSEDKSQSEKDEIAIKCGKLLSKQIIENTDDRTGLIEEVANK